MSPQKLSIPSSLSSRQPQNIQYTENQKPSSSLYQEIREQIDKGESLDAELIARINQGSREERYQLLKDAIVQKNTAVLQAILGEIKTPTVSPSEDSLILLATESKEIDQNLLQLLLTHYSAITPEETEAILKVGDDLTKRFLLSVLKRSPLAGRVRSLSSSKSSSKPISAPSTYSGAWQDLSSLDKLKFFAQLLGDKTIKNTVADPNACASEKELEGFDPSIFKSYFSDNAQHLFADLPHHKELFEHLSSLLDFTQNTFSLPPEDRKTYYFLLNYKGNSPQDYHFFSTSGHALSGKLIQHDSSYDLYLFNTGDGLSFHPIIEEGKTSPYGMVWRNIPKSVLQDDRFKKILEGKHQLNFSNEYFHLQSHNSGEVLYQSLNYYLANEAGIQPEGHGDALMEQRAGTCSRQCFDPIFRDILLSSNPSNKEYIRVYKLLKCRVDLLALSHGLVAYKLLDLQHRPVLSSLLQEGVKELSASIAKLSSTLPYDTGPDPLAPLIIQIAEELIELEIALKKNNHTRSIAPSITAKTFQHEELKGESVFSNIPNRNTDSISNILPILPQQMAAILNQFNHTLREQLPLNQFPSVEETKEWYTALESLLFKKSSTQLDTVALQTKIAALDPYFFSLISALGNLKQPSHADPEITAEQKREITALIEAFAALQRELEREYEPCMVSYWGMGLYLSGTLLFNNLTQHPNPWVEINSIKITSPSPTWERTLNDLYHLYSEPSQNLATTYAIPIFNYSEYPIDQSKLSTSLEWCYLQEEEYNKSLMSLQIFKNLLEIQRNSESLNISNTELHVNFDHPPLNNRGVRREDHWDIHGSAFFKTSSEEGPSEGTLLSDLIQNNPITDSIPTHPSYAPFFALIYASPSSIHLLSTWLSLFSQYKEMIKSKPELKNLLRIPLYNYVDEKNPFLKSGLYHIFTSNTDLVRQLLQKIKEGCISRYREERELSIEFFVLLDTLVTQELHSQRKNYTIPPELDQLLTGWLLEVQPLIKNQLLDAERSEDCFSLATHLYLLLTQQDQRATVSDLLLANYRWKRISLRNAPSSYQIRLDYLYLDKMQQLWSELKPDQRYHELDLFFKKIYPKETFKLEMDQESCYPFASLYYPPADDKTPQELVGIYYGDLGRIEFVKYIPIASQDLVPDLAQKLSEVLGPLDQFTITPLDSPGRFSIAGVPSLTLTQLENFEQRYLSIEISWNGKTYMTPSPRVSLFLTPMECATLEVIGFCSADGKSELYCKWDEIKRKILPYYHVVKDCLRCTQVEEGSPLYECYLDTPTMECYQKLKPLFSHFPVDTPPLMWFKDGQLHAMEYLNELIFQVTTSPMLCHYKGVAYSFNSFAPQEEPLGLLKGYSLQLKEVGGSKQYWVGYPDFNGSQFRNYRALHRRKQLENQLFLLDLVPYFLIIPIIEGELQPSTLKERLSLINLAIQSLAYEEAITWTKALIASHEFYNEKNLKELIKALDCWEWRIISANPGTWVIPQILLPKLKMLLSSLKENYMREKDALEKRIKSIEYVSSLFIDQSYKIPKSKKRYLKHAVKISETERKAPLSSSDQQKPQEEYQSHSLKRDQGANEDPLSPARRIPTDQELAQLSNLNYLEKLFKIAQYNIETLNGHIEDCTPKEYISREIRTIYEQHHHDFVYLQIKNSLGKEAVQSFPVALLIQDVATTQGVELPQYQPTANLKKYLPAPQRHYQPKKLHELSRPQPSLPSHDHLQNWMEEIQSQVTSSLPSLKEKEISLLTKILHKLQPTSKDPLSATIELLHHQPLPLLKEALQLLVTDDLTQWRSLRSYFQLRTDEQLLDLKRILLQYLWVKIQSKLIESSPNGPIPSRNYTAKNPLNSLLILYEYFSGIVLRQDQIDKINFLLEDFLASPSADRKSLNSRMLQSLMGSGKSKVLTPLLLLYLSKQHNCITTYITTKPMLPTAIAEISSFLYDHFGLLSYQIEVHRSMSLSQLNILKEQIAEAKMGRAVLFTSTDTFHSLHLLLPNLLLDEQDPEKYDLICELLKEVKNNQVVVIDECDCLLHPKEQMSYPLGESKNLPYAEAATASSLIFHYLSKYSSQLLLGSKECHIAPHDEIIQKILLDISDDLYHSRTLPVIDQWLQKMESKNIDSREMQEALTDLLKGDLQQAVPKSCLEELLNAEEPDQHIEDNKRALGIYQYVFGPKKGLLRALRSPYESEYGRSRINPKLHLVIPWSNAIPCEGTQFQDSYQAVLRTALYYLHEWKNPEDTSLLLKEAILFVGNTLRSFLHPELKAALDHYKVSLPLTQDQIQRVTQKLAHDLKISHSAVASLSPHTQALLSFFLNQIILPKELKIYQAQLTSTSSTLLYSSGAMQLAFSGTSEGSSAWENTFITSWDRSELPRVLEKAQHEKVIPLQLSQGTSITKKITSILSNMEKETYALIDVGGMLRGIPPKEVAQAVWNHHSKLGKKLHGVLYYDYSSDGDTLLHLLNANGRPTKITDSSRNGLLSLLESMEIIPAGESFENLALFSYYDQAHTRGSDIPQSRDANALLLYDPLNTRTDLEQGIMRMRGFLNSQSITWNYQQTDPNSPTLTAEDLIKTASYLEEEGEFTAFAQAILDRLQCHLVDGLISYCITEGDLKEGVTLARKLYPLIVDTTISSHTFSITMEKAPNYYQLIASRIEKIQNCIGKELVDYPALRKQLLSQCEKELKQIQGKQARLEARSVGENIFEGIQEINLEMNVEQNQEQELELELKRRKKESLAVIDQNERNPSITITAPLLTNLSDLDWKSKRINPNLFVEHQKNLSLLSSSLSLSPNLLIAPNNSPCPTPWLKLSHFIEGVVIYTSSDRGLTQTTSGLAIRRDETVVKPEGHQLKSGGLYTLTGDCLVAYPARQHDQDREFSFSPSNSAFSQLNLFEENPQNQEATDLLSNALLLSGNFPLLISKRNTKQNKAFFSWLNRESTLYQGRLNLFYLSYLNRGDYSYHDQLSKEEFTQLIQLLEQDASFS
jgi:hypothetical protein